MKKFIHKIQDLGQKAAHWKQVLESAPGQAAQLRDTVLMTAGQLQQMRHDVQSTATGLRADNDTRITQALREIHDGARTFLEAGYALTGIDMDLSPVQRLQVHLEKLESVPESTLRSLIGANSGHQTVHAILAALAKADAVSEKVRAPHLTYRELIVHVGPTPSVRLCWRADEVVEVAEHEHVAAPVYVAPVATSGPRPPPPIPPSTSAFTQTSFFEHRSPGAIPRPAAAAPVAGPEPAPATSSPGSTTVGANYGQHHETPPGGDWKSSALDRFKKMPEGSKYRRS